MKDVSTIIGALEQQSSRRQANAASAGLRRFRSSIRVGFLDLSAAIEAGKESTTK
jgi:hypothetical protein